jgi:hypothetical protein
MKHLFNSGKVLYYFSLDRHERLFSEGGWRLRLSKISTLQQYLFFTETVHASFNFPVTCVFFFSRDSIASKPFLPTPLFARGKTLLFPHKSLTYMLSNFLVSNVFYLTFHPPLYSTIQVLIF